jgi:aspartate aminotransferase
MMVSLASRMERLGTETAFQVMARARALEAQGRDIIHLQIGEPDFDTPRNIVDAGTDALRSGWTHYGPANGDPELRRAIAEYMHRSRGVEYDAEQVVVTPGGKPIMCFLILALLEAGDEAIFPDPGFPIYQSMIEFVDAKAVPIPLREENDFRLDVDELRGLVTERTKLLIINSPANPTGGVLSEGDLQAIAELAIENDLIVLSDEIYSELLYEGVHHSIAALPGMAERTVILDGFSKTYAMTGWRLGYGLFPRNLVEPITTLGVNSVSCTSVAVQRAGIEALTGPQDAVAEFREAFRRRRQLVVDGLNAIPGITCVMPKGAFYAFPNITATGKRSQEFADELLATYGVASVPGTSFGAAGEGYIRISYANSEANLEKALGLIEQAALAFTG